jgi:hypothetical protein
MGVLIKRSSAEKHMSTKNDATAVVVGVPSPRYLTMQQWSKTKIV